MSEKKVIQRTPVGEAKWAHVQKPKPSYSDPKGRFKTKEQFEIEIHFNPADPTWKPWYDDLVKKWAAIPTQKDEEGDPIKKQKPLNKELDEAGKETGRVFVKFATGTQFPPGVFDKYGQPLTALVGNGSKVKVAYTENVYEGFGGGINLYLSGVQVIELVPYGDKSAKSLGFETETPPADGALPPSDVNGNENPFN